MRDAPPAPGAAATAAAAAMLASLVVRDLRAVSVVGISRGAAHHKVKVGDNALLAQADHLHQLLLVLQACERNRCRAAVIPAWPAVP